MAFSGLFKAQPAVVASRRIPSTGEVFSAVGLGGWVTFNVGNDPLLRDESAAVIEAFFSGGGRVIDSSPRYGSSQEVIGYSLDKISAPSDLFATDKLWTSSATDGPDDIRRSLGKWVIPRFDPLQVHNLVAWQHNLSLLLEMKASGALRYVGVTTSHGRCHDAPEQIMRTEPLDFVQLT